jgi:hypothetical protein
MTPQLLAAAVLLFGQSTAPVAAGGYTFGTTVVSSSGLEGRVYSIDSHTKKLPRFERMKPAGTVYTNSLNIWPQRFDEGFPGVTDRFEWFALDYSGRFWVDEPGVYRFSVLSDDGSRLWIDGVLLIDLDGTHGPLGASGSAFLSRGIHQMRVSYYQGPAWSIALVLAVARPGAGFKIFDTNDFMPPQDTSLWTKGEIRDIKTVPNPYVRE